MKQNEFIPYFARDWGKNRWPTERTQTGRGRVSSHSKRLRAKRKR